MEANLKSRLATAAIGLPLVIALVAWASGWLLAAALFLVVLSALWEYARMAFPARLGDQSISVLFGAAIAPAAWPFGDHAGLILSSWLMTLLVTYLALGGPLHERLARLAWTVLGALYIGYLVPHWGLLFSLPNGQYWVFFVLAVILAGDSAAYFVGRRFGRIKLAPRLSPGKTVEGACAYVAGSFVAAAVSAPILVSEILWVEAVGLAILLSVLGQSGDLFESWLKRVFAVKDASDLLPGHGGVLDRLDSLVFPGAFATIYLRIFHP